MVGVVSFFCTGHCTEQLDMQMSISHFAVSHFLANTHPHTLHGQFAINIYRYFLAA